MSSFSHAIYIAKLSRICGTAKNFWLFCDNLDEIEEEKHSFFGFLENKLYFCTLVRYVCCSAEEKEEGIMKKNQLYKSLWPLASVLFNLSLAYVVYMIARLVFYLENRELFADSFSTFSHGFELIRGGVVFDTTAILYTNALWIVMVLFPLHLKETKTYHDICRWLFVVVNTLTLVVNLCDCVYFRYSMRRTTTTVFQEFSNEGNIGEIVMTEVFSHWYLFVMAVLVAWGLWKCYLIPRVGKKEVRWPVFDAVTFASLLAFVPFCIAGMRGGWTRDVRPITISNANNYCDKPTEAALVLNTPFSLIRTIGKNLFKVIPYFSTEAELAAVYSPVHHPGSGKPFRNKNVVVLILESFGREYIGAFNRHLDNGTYKGYTPFLDSLIGRSLTFEYSYCNGRKSIDGMPSVLSGIPMFVEPYFLSPYSNNHVGGLADCLNSKGYRTMFFHGAERGSMGFMSFARATKFSVYYGREDFKEDKRTRGDLDFDGWWGISDEPFLRYMNMKLSETPQPFMAAVFTLSSHHPFRVPDPYKDKFKEEGHPIHNVLRYTDHALQCFFQEASTQPWYENTVFVLTNDHTNISSHAEYQTDLGGFSSPVIFFDPSGEIRPEMRPAIAQQTDIMPTVLGYLGYDRPYLSFGIDLLATPDEDTWAVNYFNGIYQYVKWGHVLQFDGEKSRAVYALSDRLMKTNMLGKYERQQQMEQELKAIIQQYMVRMSENRLLP